MTRRYQSGITAAPSALRGVTAMAGTGAVALTGLATLAEGWQRASDVLASVLLASMAGIVAATLTRPRQPDPTIGTSRDTAGSAARPTYAVR